MPRKLILSMGLVSLLSLSACYTTGWNFSEAPQPTNWIYTDKALNYVETQNLRQWWHKFDDQALDKIIDITLETSPDRNIAEARIMEARGLRKTARSSLLPNIGASAETSRQDTGFSGTDNFYDARFDASYELDLFGVNRNNSKASKKYLESLEATYHDVSISLISEIIRSYIDMKAFEKQASIARKNLEIQQKTLNLIQQQKDLGEAPQLDVERSENLVNTTRASIPEFQRLADNARLQLSALSGLLPSKINEFVTENPDIPAAEAQPVLMAPSEILGIRPDIRAASKNLESYTAAADSVTGTIFPSVTLSGFFGVTESAFASSTTIWGVVLGGAVNLLDFGKIEGQIDTARAQEKRAYEEYRKTVINAVVEVEKALTDYGHIEQQRLSLQKAFDNAEHALTLSESLYKEGETSFIDLLDAQRTLNEADSALITAESAHAKSIVRLYKALGVY